MQSLVNKQCSRLCNRLCETHCKPHGKMSKLMNIRRFLLSALPFTLLLAGAANATEITIKPSITGTFVHVADAEFSGVQLDTPIEDGHEALTLSPKLSLLANGPVWKGNWTLTHTTIKQQQSNFDDTSFNNITLNNQFAFLKDRVSFFANATRQNRNVDNRFAGVSDPIFGQNEYINVDNYTTGINLRNLGGGDWRNSLRYSIGKTDFNESDLKQTNSTSTQLVKGDNQNAALSIVYGGRTNQLKASFDLQGQMNERDTRGTQKNISASFNVGIPIYSTFDFVLTGTKSQNSVGNLDFDAAELDNESYGVGLAWRISERSYIQVTENKDTQGQTRFSDEDLDKTFTSVKVVLEPSKQNSLTYSNTRRFYGEANSFGFKHTANRWSANIDYSENLGTTSRLVREVSSAGIFSCSVDNPEREFCDLLPEPPTAPIEGITFLEFFDVDYLFEEELTLTKGLSASFDYRTKKSTISISYNQGENQYLERDNTTESTRQETESVSISFNHRMSKRTSFNASYNETATKGGNGRNLSDNDGTRKGMQAMIGLERKLTRKATGSINIRRFDNDGNSSGQNRKDTRLEVNYTYNF